MRRALLLLAVLAVVPANSRAQSSAGADLEVVVRDATGGALPGAAVTLVNARTDVTRHAVTGERGRTRLTALPVGEYRLTVALAGFSTLERTGLVLEVGEVATVDVDLPLGPLAQSVTVSEATPVIEVARTQIGTVVNQVDIDSLPINGRNFLDFALTVPGVTGQQTSGTGGLGSGMSFNGQRGRSNNLSVDGADSNGFLTGDTRLTVSQEAVQEFQVVTNLFAPEFGRAGGGLVNVVSKSGTNELHGNAYGFFRDESLAARNAFAEPGEALPFRRRTVGATLGGPMARGRTFFFAAFERVDRDESDFVTISDAAVAAVNAALAARPIPRGGVTAIASGTLPVAIDTTLASFKVDHVWSAADRLSLRYSYGREEETNAGGVGIGGLVDASGGGGLRKRDQSVLLSWTRVASPTVVNEALFQYAPRTLTQFVNDEVGPRVIVSGVATFGRPENLPVALDETSWQLQDAVSWQHGAHFLKGGLDLVRVRARPSFPLTFAGLFTFGSLADFVAGRPSTFTQGFGNPDLELDETLIGLFLQDSWRVSEKLTLLYGLRYDYDMQPQDVPRDRSNPIEAPLQDGIHRDGNNIAPRASLAFDPRGDGRTVVRAGYGLFYDKIFLVVARNALLARQAVTLTGGRAAEQWVLGAFPESGSLPAGVTLSPPTILRADPQIEIPSNHQATVAVERQLGADWAAGATYVYRAGRGLLVSDNANLGSPTVMTAENAASLGVSRPSPQQIGRPFYGSGTRLDPAFNHIQVVSSSGRSRYHGLQLTLRKRFVAPRSSAWPTRCPTRRTMRPTSCRRSSRRTRTIAPRSGDSRASIRGTV